MKLRHIDLEIPKETPFQNCKLNRELYAQILYNIVSSYEDGFVLALNNDWGAGKTTFVKMWQQMMQNNEYQVVYFNAWENDFDNNFLVAFMSELKEIIKDENNYKSLIDKSAILAKHLVPSIIKAILNKQLDSKILTESLDNALKASTEIFENEIKDYTNKKQSIKDFRSKLEEYIKETSNGKPLIFIIDELDRCRPDYSVEVLEQIKHLFSVSGITFVLSIDKKHLSSAIKGYYGCDMIDTDDYLRRFIDLEYSLPAPKAEDYINYLYDYYGFDEYFLSPDINNPSGKEIFIGMAITLYNKSKPTLRVLEKIFSLTRLALSTFNTNRKSYSYLVFLLVFVKITNFKIYHKIDKNILTLQELSDLIYELLYNPYFKKDLFNNLSIEAQMLTLYNNRISRKKEDLFIKDLNGQVTPSISSKLDEKFGKKTRFNLARCLEEIDFELEGVSIQYFLERINLTQPMIVLGKK
jgi:hypothetical protein